MDRAAIQVKGLCHDYGNRRALDGIDLRIEEGEIFGLLGPNGGGKTTLFHILGTLLSPTLGKVRVLGMDPVAEARKIRLCTGVVFQSPSVDPKLTVFENLRHQGHLYGLWGQGLARRIEEVLDLVGLRDRVGDRVEVLSGGLKRRVDLAKGLLHRPALLIFDEPSAGLDPGARRAFWNDLEALRRRDGVTLVLTTHFMEEAERCDRVGILDRGRLVALGTPSGLKQGVGKDVIVIASDDSAGLQEDIAARFGQGCTLLDGMLRIECDEGQVLMERLCVSFRERIDSITLGRPTLEDVFIQRTGHGFRTEGN